MTDSILQNTLDKFTTFGDLLRYLRRRAGITQVELSIAVGYSDPQISRLEQNLRLPDIPTIEARFIAPLGLENEPRAVARLLELAARVSREDAPALGLCPYKGMDYFDEADADLFVGREALTEKLVEGVFALASDEPSGQNRLFAIVGASGSGKSSLVRAGIVPALRWNKVSSNWLIYTLTPTEHPIESLAATLMRMNGSIAATAKLMDDLAVEPRTLGMYIRREIKTSPGAYLVLVVDQFEELFALCRSEAERSAFINNLLTVTGEVDGKVITIITLRADFYAHCAGYLHLRQALAKHQEYIGAMSDEEMRRAVEEPARRGRWEFEPGLVDLILHDVGHEPGALPLLSHALLETWQRRQGRTMTLSGYTSSGGVRGAIAETAEAVFTDQLNRKQQAIARRIFLRLTELGDETSTGDTRRRATINELIMKPEESDATQVVIKALADARLVTTSENSVQVAHEALIREWPTLRGWLEDNREGFRLHRQLTEASQEWSAAGHEPDILFRGARLAQAGEWAAIHPDDMNALEKEFLQASIADSEREAAEREAQHQRELESAQKLAESESRSSKKLHKRAIYLSLALLITFIFVVLAIIFARQSDLNAQLARYGQETADAASTIAINESFAHTTAEALALNQRSTAEAARLQAIGQANIAATAEARAEGEARVNLSLNLAAAAQKANDAGLGDLALALARQAVNLDQPPVEAIQALRMIAYSPGTRGLLMGHSHSVTAAAISPDGKVAFSGSCSHLDDQGACQAGELILWVLGTFEEINRWSGHESWVTAVTISRDGQKLISGAQDGSLLIWDLSGRQEGTFVGHQGRITSLVIVPTTGNLLSGSADGTLILWDINTQNSLTHFDSTDSPVTNIAVAANVNKAVSGHENDHLFLWDLTSSKPVLDLPQIDWVNTVAINSDASRIFFTTGIISNLYLYMLDGSSGAILKESLIGFRCQRMALNPDGSSALLASISFLVQWDIQNWRQQGILMTLGGNITDLSTSRDGLIGLTAAQDGILRVWNLNQQHDQSTYITKADELTAIDISPGGKYLVLNDVLSDRKHQPGLWDTSQKKVIKVYYGFDGDSATGSIKTSPNGQYIAIAGSVDNVPTVMVWDSNSGDILCKFTDFKVFGRSVGFSPDSNYLLAGSQGDPTDRSGELILYEVQGCEKKQVFENTMDVSSIEFSQDGRRALTGSAFNSRATLWDVTSGKAISSYFFAAMLPVLTATFGPGETTILGSGEPDMHLWDASSSRLIRTYLGHSTFTWTMTISPDGRYILAGSKLGDVTQWDYKTGMELYRFNLGQDVCSIKFSPDGDVVYLATLDGRLVEWRIAEKPLPDLLNWIQENRYVRPLTDAEKLQYHTEP
jgi:WD40 repeat protein/transcriptional regulator with XRE-family HTH domain